MNHAKKSKIKKTVPYKLDISGHAKIASFLGL